MVRQSPRLTSQALVLYIENNTYYSMVTQIDPKGKIFEDSLLRGQCGWEHVMKMGVQMKSAYYPQARPPLFAPPSDVIGSPTQDLLAHVKSLVLKPITFLEILL